MGVHATRLFPMWAMADGKPDGDTGVILQERVLTQKPRLYGVYLLNDDYTPMEFVVHILEKYFQKDHAAATDIMLKVHNEGRALCGIYPYEIAEVPSPRMIPNDGVMGLRLDLDKFSYSVQNNEVIVEFPAYIDGRVF